MTKLDKLKSVSNDHHSHIEKIPTIRTFTVHPHWDIFQRKMKFWLFKNNVSYINYINLVYKLYKSIIIYILKYTYILTYNTYSLRTYTCLYMYIFQDGTYVCVCMYMFQALSIGRPRNNDSSAMWGVYIQISKLVDF